MLPLVALTLALVEPAPPHPVLCRFPTAKVAAACAESALEHEKYCERQLERELELAPGPELGGWVEAVLDSRRRREAWVMLCNAHECKDDEAGSARLRAMLGRLGHLIGPAAYEGGAMPPPVPWWAAWR